MLDTVPWQMTPGERAAFEGILAQSKPELAIEIGTAEGGSLSRIATYAREVHSIDLVEPQLPVAELDHVHIHTGDGRELLPALLADFAAEGRNVDFVMVDGDHSAAGVRQDILDLLESDAIKETIIVLHDTINEEVRRGIDDIDYASYGKVRFFDADAVPGNVSVADGTRGQFWGGLGIIFCGVDELEIARNGVTLETIVRPDALAMGARALAGFDVDRNTDLAQLARAAGPGSATVPDPAQIPWRTVLAALATFPARLLRRATGKSPK
ncbi:MAG: class I SAM-dependent methyltransferase [Solirubrobacterales bacterium]